MPRKTKSNVAEVFDEICKLVTRNARSHWLRRSKEWCDREYNTYRAGQPQSSPLNNRLNDLLDAYALAVAIYNARADGSRRIVPYTADDQNPTSVASQQAILRGASLLSLQVSVKTKPDCVSSTLLVELREFLTGEIAADLKRGKSKAPRKGVRGRRVQYSAEDDIKLLEEWERAKPLVALKQFCKGKGIKSSDFKRTQTRVRRRNAKRTK